MKYQRPKTPASQKRVQGWGGHKPAHASGPSDPVIDAVGIYCGALRVCGATDFRETHMDVGGVVVGFTHGGHTYEKYFFNDPEADDPLYRDGELFEI